MFTAQAARVGMPANTETEVADAHPATPQLCRSSCISRCCRCVVAEIIVSSFEEEALMYAVSMMTSSLSYNLLDAGGNACNYHATVAAAAAAATPATAAEPRRSSDPGRCHCDCSLHGHRSQTPTVQGLSPQPRPAFTSFVRFVVELGNSTVRSSTILLRPALPVVSSLQTKTVVRTINLTAFQQYLYAGNWNIYHKKASSGYIKVYPSIAEFYKQQVPQLPSSEHIISNTI